MVIKELMFQGPGAFSHVKKTGILAGNFGKDRLTGITVREWLEIFFSPLQATYQMTSTLTQYPQRYVPRETTLWTF